MSHEITNLFRDCGAEPELRAGGNSGIPYTVFCATEDEIETFAARIAEKALAEHLTKQIAPAIQALKRYDPEWLDEGRVRMEFWPDGDYIKYSDVVEVLAVIAAGGAK
ncbi:MAG: hypothetical protein V4772_08780 [Pseudomonadota bacterium]